MDVYAASLNEHYGSDDLLARIEAALVAAGLDPAAGAIDPDALTPLDEFHTGGREASEQLLALTAAGDPRRILDVGCGVGGPARWLARRFPGAAVTGLDIVDAYCQAARRLNELSGLSRVAIVCGDLRDPAAVGTGYDLVWSQHALMNVPDKDAVLASLRAALAADGVFAFHEAVAGPGGAPHLPVPWAGVDTPSALVTAEAWRAALGRAGLRAVVWRDTTTDAMAWIDAAVAARRAAGPQSRPLGPGPLMGADAAQKSRNLRRNLDEGRVRLLMGVCRCET